MEDFNPEGMSNDKLKEFISKLKKEIEIIEKKIKKDKEIIQKEDLNELD